MLAASPAGSGNGIQIACVLISCELLIDLIAPIHNNSSESSGVMINETQFSGLHLDGCKWDPVQSATQIPSLISTIKTNRSAILEGQGATDSLTHRSNTVVAVGPAPPFESQLYI